jgi:CRP-like cAMP-binding protein
MSLETDVQLLSRVPMLSDFAPDQLRLLAFSAENRTFRAGQRLFAVGDRADSGIVLARGTVELTDPADLSRPARRVGPGLLIDELALVVDGQRSATATAVDDVAAIVIRRPLFRRMLDEYPDIARKLQLRIATNLVGTTSALMSVKARLDALGD